MIQSEAQKVIRGKAFLVADIGGTNARFGITRPDDHHIVVQETIPCGDFNTVVEAARFFLSNHPIEAEISDACFAIAGPVHGDLISMTNHSWSFSTEEVRKELGLDRLLVINDFKAQAFALPNLFDSEKECIIEVPQEKVAKPATWSVLGPGTGFGVAALTPVNNGWKAITTEGGHAGFAPTNEEEAEIGQALMRKFGFVSREHILSGPGLINLYQAVCEVQGTTCEDLSSAQISTRAMNGEDESCSRTLALFCDILGSAAADIAVTQGAKGAVYIAGGIIPKIKPFFKESGFKEKFLRAGGAWNFLKHTPVYLVTAPYPGLIGASTALDCPLTEQNK